MRHQPDSQPASRRGRPGPGHRRHGRHGRHRRLRPGSVVAVLLLLVVTPVMVVVLLTTAAEWAFIAAIGAFAAGLVVLGNVVAPDRSTFRAGTRVWQNDGLPGGGGSA